MFEFAYDSNADVQSPVAGNAGTYSGATYQAGKFGKALYVPVGSGVVKVPFHAGIPTEKGCIEFWAKIKNPSTSYIDGGDPRFFNISTEGDLSANAVVTLMFNSNNGAGQSGICGNLGNVFWTTHSSWRMSTPYSQEFNGGDPFDWHHYAIVWNVNGVTGTTDAVRVYLDESVIWRCAVSQIDSVSFIQALRASLDLWFALPFNTTNPTRRG